METLDLNACSQEKIDYELTEGQTGPNRDNAYAEFTRLGDFVRSTYDCDIDVRYGPEERQRLDVFRVNKNPRSAPTLVFFHGGGWRVSDKYFANFYADTYLKEGFNFIAVAYSFAPEKKVGAIVEQACDAIEWIHQHASELGVGNECFIISGNSAGAHLGVSALLADWEVRSVPHEIFKCGLFFSGIYDLRWNQRSTAYANLELTEEEALAWSPLLHIRSKLPPMVVLYGDEETLLFKQMSIQLSEVWKAASNETILLNIPEGDHFSSQLIMARQLNTEIYEKSLGFIRKYI